MSERPNQSMPAAVMWLLLAAAGAVGGALAYLVSLQVGLIAACLCLIPIGLYERKHRPRP